MYKYSRGLLYKTHRKESIYETSLRNLQAKSKIPLKKTI